MITDEIKKFLIKQGCVIVASIDEKGYPHTSCKGIVDIKNEDIYMLDLYKGKTYLNLIKNTHISVTCVDEHRFKGFCLKGKGMLVDIARIDPDTIKLWKEKVAKRITSRILKNIQGKKGHKAHPEAKFPAPKYMIVLNVEEVVNLSR